MSKASLYFDLEHPESERGCGEIKRRLGAVPGVLSVSVSRDRGRVAVDYDTTGAEPDRLRGELKGCGCSIAAEHFEDHTM